MRAYHPSPTGHPRARTRGRQRRNGNVKNIRSSRQNTGDAQQLYNGSDINNELIRRDAPIKFLQINLQHARAAVAQSIQYALDNSIDIIIAQEPYTRNGAAVGFPIQWTVIQKPSQEHPPRAIIVCCNPEWSPTVAALEQDNVAILLEVLSMSLIVTSNYSPPTADIGTTTGFLNRIIYQHRLPDMIIAGDFNAHNTAWGYRATDSKGQAMEDFISSNNLVLQNTTEAPPSFDRVFAQGWPDLTLTTPHTAPFLQDWKVVDEESLSDHKYITFTLAKHTIVSKIRRYNLPGRKIKTFAKKIKEQLIFLEPTLQPLTTADELEDFTTKLQTSIQNICNQCLPVRKPKKLQGINWWSSSLRTQQSKCRPGMQSPEEIKKRAKTGNTV
ncbi:uncharacterized protein LOC118187268 [Stegodyphus dumicola]|uniref:uncharacterized protein LOC118187268 n=1 Tax=Stegodyphus dumicola TaxID=202533 RepID=UPI0015AC5648|nr:uncharacterized protein LOC118187268 [Stegodyphus dumicola]